MEVKHTELFFSFILNGAFRDVIKNLIISRSLFKSFLPT